MKGQAFASPVAAQGFLPSQHWLLEVFFPTRLHRPAYFFRAAALSIVMAMLYANNSMLDPRYFWFSLLFLVLYDLGFVVLPRIRDAGMSPWWLATIFIPIADSVLGVLLLFRAPALLRKPRSATEEQSSDAGEQRLDTSSGPPNPNPTK